MFTSFSPDVCAALNWKQPNCKYLYSRPLPPRDIPPDPVFFASLCGRESSVTPSPTVLAHAEAGDERLSSVGSAVRFSKANNLLGIIVEADILVNPHLTAPRIRFHVTHYIYLFISLLSYFRHPKPNPYNYQKTIGAKRKNWT